MWANYVLLAASTATGAQSTGAMGASGAEIFSAVFSAMDLGVAGVMLWLFIQGKLHSSEEMEHEREARKKAEEQRDDALSFIRDRLTPLVVDFTNSTGSLLPILQALVTRLELMGPGDSREREPRRDRR